MSDRCVNVDGALLRVSGDFKETPGSEDMAAATELVAAVREHLANRPPMDCHSTRCDRHQVHAHGPDCSVQCRCRQGTQAVGT